MKKLSLKNLLVVVASSAILLAPGCKGDGPDITPKNDPVIIDGTSTLPLLWKNNPDAPVDYIVRSFIDLDAGKDLVIEPGVTVQFEGLESGIYVSEGSLKAIGNSGAGITFEGKVAVKGSWKGIVIASNSLNNRMEYVTVRHAGAENLDWMDLKAGVGVHSVWNSTRMILKSCTLTENDGFGFAAYGENVTLTEFGSNTFSRNSLAPVYLSTNLQPALDMASVYNPAGSENGRAYIHLNGYYPAKVDVNLLKLPVPYRVEGDWDIQRRLTIEAGTIFEFEPSSSLRVDEPTASVVAVGNSSQKIVFRGAQTLAGAWKGVAVTNSNAGNRLEHCVFQYGGESDNPFHLSNLEIGGFASNPTCVVRNCEFRNSKGYGLVYPSGAAGVILEDNTFSGNLLGDTLAY